MTETPKLLPCPFCGGQPGIVSGTVLCPGMDCFGPCTTADNTVDSVEQWNKRAGSPEMLDLLKRIEMAFDSWADAGYMNEPKRKLWNEITAAIVKSA